MQNSAASPERFKSFQRDEVKNSTLKGRENKEKPVDNLRLGEECRREKKQIDHMLNWPGPSGVNINSGPNQNFHSVERGCYTHEYVVYLSCGWNELLILN